MPMRIPPMMARAHLFILAGKTAVPTQDVATWGDWFEAATRNGSRFVAQSDLANGVRVSTVFLGMDHGWNMRPDARPVLFESMVFGGEDDEYQERYATWEEAEAGHKAIVERLTPEPAVRSRRLRAILLDES